jgi:hypothetical protein
METTGNEQSNLFEYNKIAEALCKAQLEFTTLTKSKTARIRTKTGGEYTYKYADLSDLIDATRPALAKNGIAMVQVILGDSLTTMLIHSSGQRIESFFKIPVNLSPQEFGSALTYYRRYTMGSILGIAGEEDDDGAGAEATHKEAPRRAAPQRAPAPPPEPHDDFPKDYNPAPPDVISEAQCTRMYTIARKNGWNDQAIKGFLSTRYKVASSRDILKADYEKICDYFGRAAQK